jgi:predicted  nucleic acid-binding Zn-ribbon protein
MVVDVYKKIEKKIMGMKEKEELWKTRYRETAQQLKELMELNSKQIKAMEQRIAKSESRMEGTEKSIKRNDEKAGGMFRAVRKRLEDISENSKSLSLKLDERTVEIKNVKNEVAARVNSIISKHEKTFDSVIEKINLAVNRIQSETVKEEDISSRVETAKRFIENYRVPELRAPVAIPQPVIQPAPSPPPRAPAPQAFLPDAPPQTFGREPPFAYGLESRAAPSGIRKAPVFLDDDDLDMDDMTPVSPGTDFANSVTAMNTNVSAIADKLASIEERVARMQSERSSSADRIEDKIKMYSQSVMDVQSRMQTVEKAIRDGMTPMVESLNILTQTVKSLKEEAKPSLPKPSPPFQREFRKGAVTIERKKMEGDSSHLPSSVRLPSQSKRNPAFKYRYKDLGKEA